MGYDLHITRREQWSDTAGPTISEQQWQQAIGDDPDGDVFYWDAGEVIVKNPDRQLIAKMVRLAERLGARVRGDDGEIYREDGSSFNPGMPSAVARQSLFQRLTGAWRRRRVVAATPFRVGQRVRDSFDRHGTVISVDAKAHGGLGSVRVKLDNGNVHDRACVASGFAIVDAHPGGTDGG